MKLTLCAEADVPHVVAGEDVAPGLPPLVVRQLTRPPAILARHDDSDDVARMEVELIVGCRLVVIQCSNY